MTIFTKLSSASAIFILILLVKSLIALNAPRALVILDKTTDIAKFEESHSKFIQSIKDLGHDIEIKSADDSSLKLATYGEYKYDNLFVFCTKADVFRGSLKIRDIIEFFDSNHNVFLIGSHAPGSVVADLASELGFEFKTFANKRDYANTKLSDIYYIVGDKSKYPSQSFSYSGSQVKMLRSDLTLSILANNAPIDDINSSNSNKFVTNVLIGSLQARNNARAVISGSMDFFSDKAFEASKKSNEQLTNELVRWLLKEKSLLRMSKVQHRKLNADPTASDTNLQSYTIMDDIEYSINIELYGNGNWTPYDGDDVQFEFVRVDPFIRRTMQRRNDGTYIVRFKVPDVYGVYKMEVDYLKEGLSHLFSSTQVSVVPLRHDEYERYIFSAYPYYLSAFLMIVYLYIFTFVYLYNQKKKNN